MNVLITGGSGFVGTNLVRALKKKYKIFSPTSKELDITHADKVATYIEKHSIDAIIHAAIRGASKGEPNEVLEYTLRMYASILQSQKKVKKIIHFGSGAEYAKTRDLIKVKETEFGEYIPQDEYGFAKYFCSHASQDKNKFITLRLFGIFGPHEDYRYKFISNSIVKHILKMPIVIKQDVIFDYLYIDDLFGIVDYFLTNKNKYAQYNVSTTKSISLSEIIGIIDKVGKRDSELSIATPGYNFQYTADNTRLVKEVPNLTFTSYEQAIQKLYKHYLRLYTAGKLDVTAIKKDEYFKKSKVKK